MKFQISEDEQKAYFADETGLLIVDISNKFNPKYTTKIELQTNINYFKLLKRETFILATYLNIVQVYSLLEPIKLLYEYP